MSRFRKRINVIFLIFLIAPSSLYAGGVFMKDGSIKEGKVLKVTTNFVILLSDEGIKVQIPVRKVLRVVKHNDYRKVYTVKKKDGTEFKAYVVYEERGKYHMRIQLYSAGEIVLNREDIEALLDLEGKPRNLPRGTSSSICSPRKAALISLFPFYSGSLLLDKKPVYGYMFSAAKMVTFFGPFMAPLFATITSSTSPNAESPVDKYFKNTGYMIYFGVSLGLWAVLTVGDIIYSYKLAHTYNNRLGRKVVSGGRVFLSLMPRFTSISCQQGSHSFSWEGANLQVSMRF